jgi:hypothetical protein
MSTLAIGRFSTAAALRAGISVTLAVSGLIHAELYVHGYRYVPTIGLAFLAQASVFVALAILIAVGGPSWLRWAAGLGALALVAFALSRTIGIFGFVEHGWEPAPRVLVSVIAEALTVVLCAAAASGSSVIPESCVVGRASSTFGTDDTSATAPVLRFCLASLGRSRPRDVGLAGNRTLTARSWHTSGASEGLGLVEAYFMENVEYPSNLLYNSIFHVHTGGGESSM